MTGYPVILGGDHAAFEREWAASGRPDRERPDWPLPSFDAADWAKAFVEIHPTVDEADAVTWFANAFMRGYDERAGETAAPEWLPIEGAPKDEDEIPILIARIGQEQYPSYRVAYFDHEAHDPDYPWHVEDAAKSFNHHKDWPTHYMLLPISPKAS